VTAVPAENAAVKALITVALQQSGQQQGHFDTYSSQVVAVVAFNMVVGEQ
jgi:hypothetical protein